MSEKKPERERRNGKLKIKLEFEDAIRAAVQTEPPAKGPKKLPKRSRAAPDASSSTD